MASRREAMRERMKERLNNSQTIPASASAATSDVDEHHSSTNDDEMDEESAESVMKPHDDVDDDGAAVMIENIRAQSEQLVTALTHKRKKVKNMVTKETESKMLEDDAPEMLRNAQERMGKKLKAESSTADTGAVAAEATEAEKMTASLGILEEDASSAPPTSRSTLSKSGMTTPRKSSISMALRAKLAEKLKAAKDKGKDEAYSETIGRLHKLAGKRTESKTTRFDETGLLKGEDADEEDEMERSLKMKLRTMSTIQGSMQKDSTADLPTEEETYEFFTRVWEKTEVEGADEESETSAAAAAAAAGAGDVTTAEDRQKQEETEEMIERKEEKTGEREALLKGDEAADDERSWLPYQIARAEYVPTQERLEIEQRLLFVPSMFQAPLSERIFTASSPRHLEDEGFYVGVRPFVPNRNLRRMENRLLREIHRGEGEGGKAKDEETGGDPDANLSDNHNVKKWFGEDGQLLTLPDPVKEISSRPPIIEEIEPALMTKYHEAELPEMSASWSGGQYQLDVDVNTIVFTHHHLFSREHIRASELMHLYKEYVSRMKKQAVEYLTGKLCALKSAQRHVEDNIRRIKTDSCQEADTAVTYQEQRLKEYSDEIRLTRKQRDYEMLCDRTLLRNIIRTWKEIKLLRQNQRCTNTPIKLTIRKEETNQADDEKEWEEDIQEEMQEIQEEVAADFQKRLENYKSQLNLWKIEKLRKKEAKKRQTDRESLHGTTTFEDSEEQRRDDEEILNEPGLEKPEKPLLATGTETRQRIEAKYNEIRRKPGEPKLHLDVTNCSPITNTEQCPREEQQRRNDVSKYKIFIKVLFNNKEVSKSTAKPIGQEFLVRFAQIFNIEIMHYPESITFEIYETIGLTTDLLCTVYAAIPDASLTTVNSQLIDHEFSSEQKRRHGHEGVGSGQPTMQNLDTNKTVSSLTTSGYLSAAVVWAVDSQGNTLVPGDEINRNPVYSAMKGADVISAIGLSGLADMSKLTKWVEDSHLDPNDPANADIMHLMKPVADGGGGGVSTFHLPQHFRLEHVQEEFNFATDEDIKNNPRFRLIHLREQEIPGFKNLRIPAVENEIPDELFAAYEKKLKEDEKLKKADDADSHHLAVAKFMQKVREQIMLRFRIATHQKTFADVVYEEAVPNIGIILPSLLKLTEPRRPLKPPRKPRKTVTAQNLQAMEVKILVNIVRAVGIPVRSELSSSKPYTSRYQPVSPADEPATIKSPQKADLQSLVRPFVEVMFQQNVLATSVADGPNPSWNEELCIPFRPPQDDYSATNLQTVGDVLYLNLFDEYIVDVNQDERDRGSTIHQRIERRWLGSMQVPFSTIYSNGRIDGTFRIDKPPVLLGYVKESSHISQQMDVGSDIVFGDSEHTYLTMFLTIEPQLVSPEPIVEKFDSLENDELLLVAEGWQAELEKKFPKRDYKTTVINFEAKSVFVMRYIKPLNPPEELMASGERTSLTVARSVARYVSLIPSVSDSVVFPGLCDIWSTSSQFLQMLQGDEEEHAVLLTNYFLFIGKSAWLVIGSAIPEGPTAYVLTREESSFFLWNAGTGEHFSCHDNYCPLQSVGCLVNAENIWGNIQTNDKPSQMSFNVSNTAHWKPLFHKGFPNPGLGSIQADQLSYSTPSTTDILKLQEKIEGELKKKIAEWRPRYITRWNRLCIQTFRRLLVQLEESNGKGLQYEHFSELDQVLGSYKLCGFPINLPYTEMKSIVDSVYATGVHEYASSDVEFALAVHIQPYPSHVLSVWIYVASLVRLRS